MLADQTLEKINSLVQSECKEIKENYADQIPNGFLSVNTRIEHEDGSITGSVYKYVGTDRCLRVGSFKINGDGFIKRFPKLPTSIKNKINSQIKI